MHNSVYKVFAKHIYASKWCVVKAKRTEKLYYVRLVLRNFMLEEILGAGKSRSLSFTLYRHGTTIATCSGNFGHVRVTET